MTKSAATFSALVLALNLVSVSAFAAKQAVTQEAPDREMKRTQDALMEPLQKRLDLLQAQGATGYRNLVKIMFDESEPMDVRWRAVTAVGRVGGKHALPEIERAMNSSTWYMRNAGLLALQNIDPQMALSWARKLMSDKALVVRASAVDILKQFGDRESIDLLWQKIDAPENFRNGQSLYIRRHIADALKRLDGRVGREAKFVRLLNDKDLQVQEVAVSALEKITDTRKGASGASLNDRRAEWQRWWNERRG